MELESNRRADTRTSLQNGTPILTDFADNDQRLVAAPGRLRAGRVEPQRALGRACRAALGGHSHPGLGRGGPARGEQPEQRLDAAPACGVEARPEGARPGAHQPDAQLPLAHALEPDRPAERQHALPGAGAEHADAGRSRRQSEPEARARDRRRHRRRALPRRQRPAERERLPPQHQQLHAQRDDAGDGVVRGRAALRAARRRTSATRSPRASSSRRSSAPAT